MGLTIVGRSGRTGQVIITDDRPEGTAAVFVCDPLDDLDGAIAVPPEQVVPSPRGKFPWLDRLQATAANLRADAPTDHFEVTVDTSQLNSGPIIFHLGPFIAQVLLAVEKGVTSVELSADNREQWGYLRHVGNGRDQGQP